MTGHSPEPTQFAVICPDHGQVFLTYDEYNRQLRKANSLWMCPLCGQSSTWDDDNYELRGVVDRVVGEADDTDVDEGDEIVERIMEEFDEPFLPDDEDEAEEREPTEQQLLDELNRFPARPFTMLDKDDPDRYRP